MPEKFISRSSAEADLLYSAVFLAENASASEAHADAMLAIVPILLDRGEIDLAAELANAVEDPYVRDRLLIDVAEKCAAVDDVEYAIQLCEAIEEHGMQAQAFERVALARIMKGDLEKADEIAATLAHPDLVYAAIAEHQFLNGDESNALETMNRIEFPTARVAAFQRITAAMIQKGEFEKALSILGSALEDAEDIEHEEEQLRAICDIGIAFVDANDNEKAILTLDLARGRAAALDNIHKDFFLVNCALGFLQAGNEDEADHTLDLITDKTQMASALLGLARHYWKHERNGEAVETLDEAHEILLSQRERETRDSKARYRLMATIASQFAGFGKAEQAISVAEEIEEPNERSAALREIAQVLILLGSDDLARKALTALDEDSERMFALVGMSDAKVKLGKDDEALTVLKEAAEMSDSLERYTVKSNALNEIAMRFIDLKDRDTAKHVASENLSVITMIKDEGTQAKTLADLSNVYKTGGFEFTSDDLAKIAPLINRLGW